ncbi:hypothetical protein [Streptomyces sp. G-G2]|uniref:hypothetical protein n=1 Tax=Streptomyces sp. G-G2 TaxID=3046201 RepID=UPI0024B8FAAF|nr:hypothetical protein [Streptomyces sp. G-G2]MDJ0383500.1 hypothetical protein [Streptomyces sp. G-G2]
MDQNEVIRKVVGILTEAYDAFVHPEADDAPEDEPNLMGQFLTEAMPRIEISSDASLQEVADQVGREMGRAVTQLAAAFAAAYVELALVHDESDPATSSAEVLRDMAIRAEGPDGYDWPQE